MISFSAPAKIILSGEHSVVYGKPAFAAGIDKRLRVSIFGRKGFLPSQWSIVEKVVLEYLSDNKIKFTKKSFSVRIESDIPKGRGLGSSAAFAVASTGAYIKFLSGRSFDKQTINNLAYKIEKEFHGRPSGIDNSTSCFGGLIFFRKEFEFLKVISRLNFKIPDSISNRLYLIDTGKPKESTKDMVEFVGRRFNKNPLKTRIILSEIERSTKQMVVSVVKEDQRLFAESVKKNHLLLDKLGVVSDWLKRRLSFLEKYGAYKITGAGSRKGPAGFVLFIDLSGEGDSILKKTGFKYFRISFDNRGLVEL